MDYKKKYREAQKWIESIYSELSHEQQMEAEAFFPELKESEDERIRKEIIATIHLYYGEPLEDEAKEMIAWLEKQGKKSPSIIWHNINEEPEETKELFCEWESDDATWHDVAFYDEESKTFRLDKKPINVTKWVYVDELLEKQGEQKPTDKVEPKFKVGDWVVYDKYDKNDIDKIVKFDNDKVSFESGDWLYINQLNEDCKLWTIQDAKDGDVLVASDESLFIFAKVKDNAAYYHFSLCKNGSKEISDGKHAWETVKGCHPATKEQRNILFAKMKEAGYEWNTEKKELKKISQRMVSAEAKEALYDKPAWSEEDEDAIRMAIIALEDMYDEDAPNTTYGGYNLPFNKAAERLKSLKERYTWKPSDEQMDALAWALSLAKNCGEENAFDLRTLYEQLKKLKGE